MGLKYEFFDGGPDPKKAMYLPDDGKPSGHTATEIDANMRKEGWGGLFKDDQERDHCKFLEKQIAEGYTGGRKCQLKASAVKHLMAQYKRCNR
uniref:Uncharacterized protein n=1 Tax=viral metagenome TaxID=1070528 RepID=A0A6M3L9P2_9ZZZZ